MEAVAACGDRVPGRLRQAPAIRLLVIQAGSVSRATRLRRYRPWSYQVLQVPEARSPSPARPDKSCHGGNDQPPRSCRWPPGPPLAHSVAAAGCDSDKVITRILASVLTGRES